MGRKSTARSVRTQVSLLEWVRYPDRIAMFQLPVSPAMTQGVQPQAMQQMPGAMMPSQGPALMLCPHPPADAATFRASAPADAHGLDARLATCRVPLAADDEPAGVAGGATTRHVSGSRRGGCYASSEVGRGPVAAPNGNFRRAPWLCRRRLAAEHRVQGPRPGVEVGSEASYAEEISADSLRRV